MKKSREKSGPEKPKRAQSVSDTKRLNKNHPGRATDKVFAKSNSSGYKRKSTDEARAPYQSKGFKNERPSGEPYGEKTFSSASKEKKRFTGDFDPKPLANPDRRRKPRQGEEENAKTGYKSERKSKYAGSKGYGQQGEKPRFKDRDMPFHLNDKIIKEEKSVGRSRKKFADHSAPADIQESVRLNKFISNAGVCSRREADVLIQSGVVKVNGKIITEMGYKVMPGDVVNYGGASLSAERKRYLLLNKPKDYITTADDPDGRKTVMELIKNACQERLYPVGRLDRSTTGLLLFTNDGELAKRLTHPSHGVKKMYHVGLDKNLKPIDYKAIIEGVELEDGRVEVDNISFVDDGKNKREVGIEIHSGRNRVIRRLFESLGYKVEKLDRVVFAGLTKKDLPRGRWRFLNEKEIAYLKMSTHSK